jgi:hypothetical protein
MPEGSLLTASFRFVDGTGTVVSRRVGDMLTTRQLYYGYTDGGGCPTVYELDPAVYQLELWRVYPLAGPIMLVRGTTSLKLRLAPDLGGELRAHRAILVIDGLAYDEAPRVMYEVALQAPNGKKVTVGIVHFFNETADHHQAAENKIAPAGRSRMFDATEALRALGGGTDAQLVLEPTTGVTGVSAAEAAKQIDPRAKVRFSAARIELH